MRLLALLVLVATAPLAAQGPPPPPPPPPDPEWARTEGPSWGSYACPDGSIVFLAHVGSSDGLVYTEATGEIAARVAAGVWTADGIVATRQPGQRFTVTADGAPVGGGPCSFDRKATVRDRIDGLDGLWIADARLNPKPERIGLYVPDGFTRGDFRRAFYLGTDRIAIRLEDIEASETAPSFAEDLFDLGFRLSDERFGALRALRTEHAGQPLALLADGVLIGEVHVLGELAEDRVLTVSGLDEERLSAIRGALGAD